MSKEFLLKVYNMVRDTVRSANSDTTQDIGANGVSLMNSGATAFDQNTKLTV